MLIEELKDYLGFAVAGNLLLLDRWESTLITKLNRFDVSARGNGTPGNSWVCS